MSWYGAMLPVDTMEETNHVGETAQGRTYRAESNT